VVRLVQADAAGRLIHVTPTTLASSSWTPGDTLTLVGLILTAAALVLSPLITRRVMNKAEHDRWVRDRRTDAIASTMSVHGERNEWRKSTDHDPAAHPTEVGVVPVLMQLFSGDLKAEKQAVVASVAHREYRAAVGTLRSDVAAQIRPSTVTQAELQQLDAAATAAEWAFYEQGCKDLGLPDPVDSYQDRPGVQPVMGDGDRGSSQPAL